MIAKLKGTVDSIDADSAVIDVNGVGYLISASARREGPADFRLERKPQSVREIGDRSVMSGHQQQLQDRFLR